MVLEVCVDTVAGLAAAVSGGAGRVELCAALEVGGLTPSVAFMRHVAGAGVPVYAMIRPRAGDFAYSTAEVGVMEGDIAAVREAGLAGVVFGASLADGALDGGVLGRLRAAAAGLGTTLHRAFDLVPDAGAALEVAVGLGFERILSSGGMPRAADGAGRLAELVGRAGGRIGIMAGGGIDAANVAGLMRRSGVREVHASCRGAGAAPGRLDGFGFGRGGETEAGRVRALAAAIEECGQSGETRDRLWR